MKSNFLFLVWVYLGRMLSFICLVTISVSIKMKYDIGLGSEMMKEFS